MDGSRTPFEGNGTTVHAALQVSGTGWILAVGDPSDTSKAGMHRLAPQDVDGLPGRLGRARRRAAASGGDVRVMLVYGAGHQGFRWPVGWRAGTPGWWSAIRRALRWCAGRGR